MAKKKAKWKVTLKRSNYTGVTEGKLIPDVLLKATYTLDDLVDRITRGGGCGLTAETLRHAARLLMDKAEDCLLEGAAVSLPLGRLTPSVTGTWQDDGRHDPAVRAQNGATVRFVMSASLRRALADPQLEVAGRGARHRLMVYTVHDTATGTDNECLTPGRPVIVTGEMLLMNGSLDARGLYLHDAMTGEVMAHIRPEDLIVNTRRKMIAVVPAELPAGRYFMRVVSQCSTSPRPMREAVEFTLPVELECAAGPTA